MGLPEKWLKEGQQLAEGAAIFGTPLTKLSREDLLAVAAHGWKAYNDSLQQRIRDMEIVRGLHAARPAGSNPDVIDFMHRATRS